MQSLGKYIMSIIDSTDNLQCKSSALAKVQGKAHWSSGIYRRTETIYADICCLIKVATFSRQMLVSGNESVVVQLYCSALIEGL